MDETQLPSSSNHTCFTLRRLKMAWMKHHFPQVQSVIHTCFTPRELKMENSTSLKLISVIHTCFRPRELNGMDETQLA